MVHFVFDLDATLADVTFIYYCIIALRNRDAHPALLGDLETNVAYALFVQDVLSAERSATPLGVLRPGVLSVMEKLHAMKKKGLVTSVTIYSNNQYLPNLEFVRDVIHAHVGSKHLISQCIHWNHPLRNQERSLYPHLYPKTWNGLLTILSQTSPNGSYRRIMAKDVFFFDDMDHIDLQNTLQANYYKVPAYHSLQPIIPMLDLFTSVLQKAHLDTIPFALHVADVFGMTASPMSYSPLDMIRTMMYLSMHQNAHRIVHNEQDTAMNALMNAQTNTLTNVATPVDAGIEMMKEAINRVKLYSIRMKKYRKRSRTFKKRRFTQR